MPDTPSPTDGRASEDISQAMPQDMPEAGPPRAAVLQARRGDAARIALVREFGYLDAGRIGEESAGTSHSGALADRWREEGRVFAVAWRGRTVYPGFQFDEHGAPLGVVADVLAALPRDRMTDWELALWWTAANGWLAGDRPVDRLLGSDSGAIVTAAERLAEPSPL